MAKWFSENRRVVDEGFLDPAKAFADIPQGFADSIDQVRMLAANDDLLRLYNQGEDPPADELGRYLLRLRVAEEEFKGQGAESEEAFFQQGQAAAQFRVDERELIGGLVTHAARASAMPSEHAGTFGDWLKTAMQHPGFDMERVGDYAESFTEVRRQLAERQEPIGEALEATWLAAVNGANLPLELIGQVPDELFGEFLESLRLRVTTLPDAEQERFLAGMRKDLLRVMEDYSRNIGESVGGRVMAGTPLGTGGPLGVNAGTMRGMEQQRQADAADMNRQEGRAMEIRRILRSDYDPIDYQGQGILQKTPGVTATSMTFFVPVVGQVAMAAMLHGSARESAYLKFRDHGLTEADAMTAANTVAPFVMVPQFVLNKIQFGIWARKIPWANKALNQIGDKIVNRGLRFAARTGAITGVEATLEVGEDFTESIVHDIAAALNPALPDVDLVQEFKGAWANYPEYAGTMVLLSMFGAAGGINAEARANAFREASELELRALGLQPEAIDRIKNAPGYDSANTEINNSWPNRDANSPEAKAAAEELAVRERARREAANQLRASGDLPIIVAGREGYTVLDGRTEETVGTAPSMGAAWTMAQAHSDFLADLDADAVAYMKSLLESADFVQKLDPNQETRLELGTVMDRALLEAERPEMAARFAKQVELKEQAAGGTGEISYTVNGWSESQIRDNLRQTVNRIFQGGSVLTVFHEFTHGRRRALREAGQLSREEEVSFVRAIDAVLAGKRTREGERLSFLPEGITDEQITEEMIDEAISEVMEMEILRSRSGGTKRRMPQRPGAGNVPSGFVTRNLTALARLAPEATRKFSAFIESVRAHFGQAMARALAIKKAEREGKFDADSYDAFLAKLLGLDVQDDFNRQTAQEAARIADPLSPEAFAAALNSDYDVDADDIPFSIARSGMRYPEFRLSQFGPVPSLTSHTGVLYPDGHEIDLSQNQAPAQIPDGGGEFWNQLSKDGRHAAVLGAWEAYEGRGLAEDWIRPALIEPGANPTDPSVTGFWNWLRDTLNSDFFRGIDPVDTMDLLVDIFQLEWYASERDSGADQHHYVPIAPDGTVLALRNDTGQARFARLPDMDLQPDLAFSLGRSTVTIGARPGEYGWTPGGIAQTEKQERALRKELAGLQNNPEENAERIREIEEEQRSIASRTTPGPITHPTQSKPRLERVGAATNKILNAAKAKALIKDLFGVEGLQVRPTIGSWLGNLEPSFELTAKSLSDEQAAGIGALFGFAWAQDATIVGRPNESLTEGIPAYFLGQPKRLTKEQVNAIFAESQKRGIDFATTADGKSAKFLYFGDEAGKNDFEQAIRDIQQAVGLPNAYSELVSSDLNETETDFSPEPRGGSGQAWIQTTAEGLALLERVIDSFVAPYAKAVGSEGYRFNIDLFAKRFGLNDTQAEIVRDALYPKHGSLKSAARIMTGQEKLEVQGRFTKKGVFKASVTNVVWALQNWSAKHGLISPGDYSERAKKLIAQTIYDEVQWHVNNAKEHGLRSAIGWYDRALKAAKAIYSRMFAELEEGGAGYDIDKALVFDAMLGIASQGNPVTDNSVMSTRVYARWRKGGMTILEAVAPLSESFGSKTVAIENNFAKLQALLDQNTYAELRKFLNKKDTVGNINAHLRKNQKLWFNGKPLSVEGKSTQKVTGWMVFGPKIGSFINNLHGDYTTLTADLWFSRTWNRILGWSFVHSPELEATQYLAMRDAAVAEFTKDTGPKKFEKGQPVLWENGDELKEMTPEEFDSLINDPEQMLALASRLEEVFRKGQYKQKSDLRRAAKNWVENRENVLEAPRTDLERDFQQAVMEKAQKMLKRAGIDITIADMQAALWYNEKDLFKMLGSSTKNSAPADYEDAARITYERIRAGTLYERIGDEAKKGGSGRILSKSDEASIFAGMSLQSFSLGRPGAAGQLGGINPNQPGGANIGDAALPESKLHQRIKEVIPLQANGEYAIAIVEDYGVKEHAFRHGDGMVAVISESSHRWPQRIENHLFRLFQEVIGREKLGPDTYIRVTNSKDDFKYLKEGIHHGSKNHGLNDFDTETDPNEGGISVSRYFEFPAKYAYLVKGERITTGTDGEPVLDAATARPIGSLTTYETLVKKLGEWEDRPRKLSEKFFFSNASKSAPWLYGGVSPKPDLIAHPFNQSPPADSGAASLAPSRSLDLMRMNALDRVRNPRRRAEIFQRISREFERLKLDAERFELVAGSKRMRKSLLKEAAMREAVRREELENDVYARHWELLSNEDLVRIKSQPVHAALADPDSPLRGRLMSRSAAMKHRAELFGEDYKGGEWDGSDGLSRSIFGGTLTPDQAAQELYDEGLINSPDVDTLWQALHSEQAQVAGMKEQLAQVQQQLRAARTTAKQEANDWLRQAGEGQAANYSPKQEILRALASMQAILRALPPPVRAKIGGIMDIARAGSEEARLAILKDTIAKSDRELEKWMRETLDREFRELLERTRPERDEAGKRPKGKIGANVHDLFRSIEDAMFLDAAETEAEATRLESLAEAEATTAEQAAHLTLEANLVRLVGDWRKADAARREMALAEATSAYAGGYLQAQIKAAQKRERITRRRADLKHDTGRAGERMERVNAEIKARGTKLGRTREALLSIFSFDQMLGLVFGEGSATARSFAEWELRAANAKENAIQRTHNAVEALLNDLAGNPLAGEKLRYKLATERRVEWIDWQGRKQTATEMEAVSYTLWWAQADGRRHMEGQIEENADGSTTVTSDWHWREEDVAAIERQLSKEAKAIRLHLRENYGAEYDRINAVFSDLYGVNMPRHKDYSPIAVAPQHAPGGQMADPVSGTMQGPGLTPGSLKNRSHSAVAEPQRMDALQHYVAHVKQMEHFIAYGQLSSELMAIVNNRELGNSIEAKAGKEALNILRAWTDYFAQGGTRDAAAHLAVSGWFQRGLDRISQMALVGRVSVLAIQSVQLGAATYQMPVGSYLTRLAKLTTGQLGWGKAIRSDYIQRRLAQMPPAVQQAMQGLASGPPSRLKHETARLGSLISGADALFTAGTYAIIYDYQLKLAKDRGMPSPEQWAQEVTILLTDQVAQPMRAGARSLIEVTATNPAFRMMWAFASEPRQKIALSAYGLMQKTGLERFRAAAITWTVSGLLAAVVRAAVRDLRDDGEDDEVFDETNWDPTRLALMALSGPIGGLPIVGKEIENMIYAGAGEYMPGSTLISGPSKAAGTIRKLATGKGSWEDAIKDAESILMGVGVASPTAAAAASWSHIARDLEAIYKNTTED
jgi:hypothetical protein